MTIVAMSVAATVTAMIACSAVPVLRGGGTLKSGRSTDALSVSMVRVWMRPVASGRDVDALALAARVAGGAQVDDLTAAQVDAVERVPRVGRGQVHEPVAQVGALDVLDPAVEAKRRERAPAQAAEVVAQQLVASEAVHRVGGAGAGVDGDEGVLVLRQRDRVDELERLRVEAGDDLLVALEVGLLERHVEIGARHVDVADVVVAAGPQVVGDRRGVGVLDCGGRRRCATGRSCPTKIQPPPKRARP